MDYGKCACTFVDTATGYAVRILARDDARESVWRYVSPDLNKGDAQREAYKIIPDELLFVVRRCLVDILSLARPGRPTSRVACAVCGEGINDRREVRIYGKTVCRACAQGGYYRRLTQPVDRSDAKDNAGQST